MRAGRRAVNALKEAGFPDEQAVAAVYTIGGAMTEGLATETDLAGVKGNIAELRTDRKSGSAEVKAEVVPPLVVDRNGDCGHDCRLDGGVGKTVALIPP